MTTAGGTATTANRRRYAKLKAEGRLMQPGIDRPPTDKSGDAPKPPPDKIPKYIEQAIKKNHAAWTFFQKLAPSHRRNYIAWIDSAKQETTKFKRLNEAIRLLAAGQKLGLK